MQIILQEEIEKLGDRGEIVTVAEGYARNYLLPRKLAIEATPNNLKRLEKMRVAFATKAATEKGEAQTLGEVLSSVSLEFVRKVGENDHLFGSVTVGDISEALAAKGYHVDKKRVMLGEPIKALGDFEVPLKLHRDVTTPIKVTVKKEE